MTQDSEQDGPQLQPGQARKLAFEMGPLLIFFISNYIWGIIPATGILVVATLISVAASYILDKRIPMMALIAAGFLGFFGGLTVLFEDDTFIKIKPTVVSGLFGAFLIGGYMLGKAPLKLMMGLMLDLKEEGWRKLTLRWGFFFFFLAGLNEVVWRMVSTDTWVSFKVFGLLPITMVFAASQMPLMQKYAVGSEE